MLLLNYFIIVQFVSINHKQAHKEALIKQTRGLEIKLQSVRYKFSGLQQVKKRPANNLIYGN